MCRNIKTLYHLSPPVTEEEIRDAARQYVRKVSGFGKPSRANEAAFAAAVDEIAAATARLLAALETGAPTRSRAATDRRRAVERAGGQGSDGSTASV
jgi:hypothetical protein